MYPLKDKEGTIINNVREDWFADYDCRKLIGNIDFSVAVRKDSRDLFPETEYLLWAEAKQGNRHSIYDSFIQLILTIGKERTIDKNLPPKFLGAFDAEKIAFIPYSAVMEVFSQNDFNWNVTPSDHDSKEFMQLKNIVRRELDSSDSNNVYVFYFDQNPKELRRFIKRNFVSGRDSVQRIRVNHNNFKAIYERWRQEVMPTIAVDWDNVKRSGLLDADFYLADLMAENNLTLLDNLNVLLRATHYEVDRKIDTDGLWQSKQVQFRDTMQAHKLFWSKYARPPKREYWDRIVERRDLLVPQDIRERKGSYFTPAIWVQKSQEYLEDTLGENWQDEYYVWDCCAGTGNLLAGLTNKYNIWASTLDKADVDVMHQRIEEMGKGSNLLKSHVFQFDFLNDSFDRLPQGLQDIISDPDRRRKLVIYINPPYVETAGKRSGINDSNIQKQYIKEMGLAAREVYAQFLYRVYAEIPGAILAEFSKLKILQGSAFKDFRENFQAKLLSCFVVPAKTFDNVDGNFPISFKIWNTHIKESFREIETHIYNADGEFAGKRVFRLIEDATYFSKWVTQDKANRNDCIAWLEGITRNDFQGQNKICLLNEPSPNNSQPRGIYVGKRNVLLGCVGFAVRHCIEATWLNDRDQFLYPNDGWQANLDFQSDCLAYTLFHGQNRISTGNVGVLTRITSDDMRTGTSSFPVNHWIPFYEHEVDAPDNFQSHFMADFIAGKHGARTASPAGKDLFSPADAAGCSPAAPQAMRFTPAAQEVMEAGRKLWHYYLHHTDGLFGAVPVNVNASFYDIRAHFQGRDEKGKMNSDSKDEEYMRLLKDLRQKQKTLAAQIAEKVYQYGFLK